MLVVPAYRHGVGFSRWEILNHFGRNIYVLLNRLIESPFFLLCTMHAAYQFGLLISS